MAFPTLTGSLLADAIIGGAGYTKYNNANAYIGVGNGTTAFSAAQTDLQGGSKTRKGMDASYPQRTDNTVTWIATYATGDANYAWEEWGLFNAAAGGQMLNRKVENLGTKTSSATWQLAVSVAFNV
mgnify:CR=1 FL=1